MENTKGNKIIFKPTKDNIELEVRLDDETVWLNQAQMAQLFDRDRDTISEHIQRVFKDGELEENPTTRNFRVVQNEGKRKVLRDVIHYSLDMIISVGYRVNSKKGTQFRIWATKILRDHIVQGYTINHRRLELEASKYKELQVQLQTLKKVYENKKIHEAEAKGLIKIITDYADGLTLIDKFDRNKLEIPASSTHKVQKINYENAINDINTLRNELKVGELFGQEKDDGFKSSLQTIFQTFDGKDLYISVEEKAANLLYLIIKNHSFVDGNKRIGSFIFIRFLDLNGMLYNADATKRIEENALVAIALMIAQSDPKNKDLMVRLVVNLI